MVGGHGQVPAGGKKGRVPEDNGNNGNGDGATYDRQIGNEWTGTDGEAAQTRTQILSTGTRIRVMVR